MKTRFSTFVIIHIFLSTIARAGDTADGRPRLVVFISVDQMREDYFERFHHQLSGGLQRLYKDGIFYRNADLNYSSSVTCLGHASMSTGSYPRTNGILENEWIDPVSKKSVYCASDTTILPVDGEGGGVSPKNLRVTAIGDWLRAASPHSKVISASIKDRAAVMMGGKNPSLVFWYRGKTGHMVTNEYYSNSMPAWAKTFNNSGWIEHHVPDEWNCLLPDNAYGANEPDQFEAETPWNGSTAFPHKFSENKKNEQLRTSPYGDMMVLDFAVEAIRGEKLGQRDVTDLLCLSLSDCDYIGHDFGPNSREMHDHILRLDRMLGSFFDSVEKLVGRSNMLIVLSADHGVMPLPEFLSRYPTTEHAEKGAVPHRLLWERDGKKAIDSLDAVIRNEWGIQEPVFLQYGFLNYSACARVGRDSLMLEKRVRDAFRQNSSIADVYFRRELEGSEHQERPYLENFRRSYYSPAGEDYQIRFNEYTIYTSKTTGTTHGSTYRYDTHVPIVFWREGWKHRLLDREVHTVDIAPTLATLLGLPYPLTVDGKPLQEIIQ